MKNYCLVVQYDGTNYAGFQIQPNQPTIQGKLEKALAKLVPNPISIVGSGRTDSGVHSEGQTVNFCTDKLTVPVNRLPHALNRLLPRDIRVIKSQLVPLDFNARYSALEKTYRYQIYEGPFPNVFYQRYSYWTREALEWDRIAECAQIFVGELDFAAFASSGSSVKTTTRTISRIEIAREGSFHVLRFTANGFLYNMVRNLVGTLYEVGRGKLSLTDVGLILASKDRRLAGATMPPQGLFLESVKYS